VVADEHALSGQAAADPGPEAQVLERAELAVVGEAIRSLSPGHREVLGLVFGADLTLAGAAEVLGVPVGTVKSRLAAARAALARAMGGKGVGRS
jgi:RNA polymerase sigma-70 factor (ECF subfamily)